MVNSSEGTPTQESISTKYAPLESRLAHLGVDSSSVEPKITAGAIALQLDIHSNQVRRMLQRFNVESEYIQSQDGGRRGGYEYYPHYATEFVQEEKAWRDWYLTLPKRMSTGQIAEAVGRSYGWTEKTLAEFYSRKSKHPSQQPLLYSRDAVKKLREITLSTPPDEDWHTIPTLATLTGKSRDWILNQLEASSVRPENRRQAATGRDFPHYPPETLVLLFEANQKIPEPAGDWLTANALVLKTGKSTNWVRKRLDKDFIALGEPRLDDMTVIRIHYPPLVLEAMLREIEEVAGYPDAGDWVLLSNLRRSLGVHAVTLTRMMEQIEVETEIRIDMKGRPKQHLSPNTQRQLAKLVLDRLSHPDANGWLTFTEVQKRIEQTSTWIRKELEAQGITPEIRLDGSKRPAEHYNPELIQQIIEYLQK